MAEKVGEMCCLVKFVEKHLFFSDLDDKNVIFSMKSFRNKVIIGFLWACSIFAFLIWENAGFLKGQHFCNRPHNSV